VKDQHTGRERGRERGRETETEREKETERERQRQRERETSFITPVGVSFAIKRLFSHFTTQKVAPVAAERSSYFPPLQ